MFLRAEVSSCIRLSRSFSSLRLQQALSPIPTLTIDGHTCVTGIEPGATFADVFGSINDSHWSAAYYTNPDWDMRSANDTVATGSHFVAYENGEPHTRTAVVRGDVTGTGTIDAAQILATASSGKQHFLYNTALI